MDRQKRDYASSIIFDYALPIISDYALPIILIVVHLSGALIGALLQVDYSDFGNLFKVLGISGAEFFRQLFITGVFLYALCFSFRYFGFQSSNSLKFVGGVIALSLAVSILLAADAYQSQSFQNTQIASPAAEQKTPDSFASLFYTLLTKHQALLALTLISLAGVAIGTYYVFRSLFAVEYSGAGLQIRLPGQQVIYLPVYPQISWQNTKIVLKEGEKVSIDLSGYVSPGALLTIPEAKEYMKNYTDYVKQGSKPEDWAEIVQKQSPTWLYTGPEGYKEEWYGPEKIDVLKYHPIYKEDYYFRKDSGLTVKGLPHNVVLGIIRAVGESLPKVAGGAKPAYDWSNNEDQQMLLYLSTENYPITIEVKKSGELWVVINDVDMARWDNAGMFFLKVTRHSWL